jgi:hypothetical protein
MSQTSHRKKSPVVPNTKRPWNNHASGNFFNLLENICFGPHFFELAMLLRESMLTNGTLINAEIWYNFSKNELEEFEVLDRLFLR